MTKALWKNENTGESRVGIYEKDGDSWYVFISGELLKKEKGDKPEWGPWKLVRDLPLPTSQLETNS
jgi:hypothetical protein